jgi:hypothetical protein
MEVELAADDWRKEIADYLRDPFKKVDRWLWYQATKYVLIEDELCYRTIDEVLLKCLGKEEAKNLMGEIHEGTCGAHQSAFKMKWMIRKNGYFWQLYWRIDLDIINVVRNVRSSECTESSGVSNEPND